MIDYAQERYEARDLDLDDDDLRYELEQQAASDEADDLHNGPCVSPYRCVDRMCGALDCLNCHPGCDSEEAEDA